jgi:hypothetical protein
MLYGTRSVLSSLAREKYPTLSFIHSSDKVLKIITKTFIKLQNWTCHICNMSSYVISYHYLFHYFEVIKKFEPWEKGIGTES